MKRFFLPLKKEYYLKIKNGEQDCEIRPNNHRAWNTKNIYTGRSILLSLGYGKSDRIIKVLRGIEITTNLSVSNIPDWHINAVEEIYGKRDEWLVAYF